MTHPVNHSSLVKREDDLVLQQSQEVFRDSLALAERVQTLWREAPSPIGLIPPQQPLIWQSNYGEFGGAPSCAELSSGSLEKFPSLRVLASRDEEFSEQDGLSRERKRPREEIKSGRETPSTGAEERPIPLLSSTDKEEGAREERFQSFLSWKGLRKQGVPIIQLIPPQE